MHNNANQFIFKARFLGRLLSLLCLLKSVLVIHDFKVRVWFEVYVARELKVGVYLFILVGVEVKYDTVEMHNQNIGSFRNKCSLADVYLLVASLAHVVADYFSLDHCLKTGLHARNVLNSQRQV
jgi:hypothetical protein